MATPSQAIPDDAPGTTKSTTQGTDIRVIAAGLFITTLVLEGVGLVARWVLISGFIWTMTGLSRFFAALISVMQSLQPNALPSSQSGTEISPATTALQTSSTALTLIVYLVTVLSSVGPIVVWLVTYGPPLASILTLLPFVPGGFFFRRFALGAREPSAREENILNATLSQLQAASSETLPAHYGAVYILDKPGREAHVIGNTLYLSATLVDSPYLAPILAHELFHANTFDGRLVLALRRLVLFPVYLLSRTFGQVAPGVVKLGSSASTELGCVAGAFVWFLGLLLSLAGGGFGLWLMNLPWAWFWKQREFAADQYAISLGQQGNLIQYLEDTKGLTQPNFDITAPYLIIEPPANELRRDRLERPDVFRERVDLRPVLVIGGVLIALFCVLPSAIAGVNRFVYRVEGKTWTMTQYCYTNCGINFSNGVPMELFNTLTFTDGKYHLTEIGGGGPREQTGTYTYVDKNHVSMISDRNNGVAFGLNDTYEVRREGNSLLLVGDRMTYVYSESPYSSSTPGIIGAWVGGSGGVLYFGDNGTYTQTTGNTASPGTYSVSGNILQMVNNYGGGQEFTYVIEGDSLTMTDQQGQAYTYARRTDP